MPLYPQSEGAAIRELARSLREMIAFEPCLPEDFPALAARVHCATERVTGQRCYCHRYEALEAGAPCDHGPDLKIEAQAAALEVPPPRREEALDAVAYYCGGMP